MDRISGLTGSIIWALLIALFAACASSPTVPVPPPEAVVIHPPNEEGFALVEGQPDSALAEDVILVFNKDLGRGAMTVAEQDGSFSVEVEARIGDRLSVQVVRDDTVSDEDVIKTVPSADETG